MIFLFVKLKVELAKAIDINQKSTNSLESVLLVYFWDLIRLNVSGVIARYSAMSLLEILRKSFG